MYLTAPFVLIPVLSLCVGVISIPQIEQYDLAALYSSDGGQNQGQGQGQGRSQVDVMECDIAGKKKEEK